MTVRAVTLGALLFAVACGGAPPRAATPAPHWTDDFFVERPGCAPAVQDWGTTLALSCGNHIYASRGDDMPTQVLAALGPLAASHVAEPHVALLGIGSGVELGTFLAAGAYVDLYEPDPALLSIAHFLAPQSGLVYEADVPVHPRLHIVTGRADAPAEAPTYDIIAHANATTVLSFPPRVFVRERLERLVGHLAPGGVMGAHLQLYEIHVASYQRFAATFAAAFGTSASSSDVLVLAGDARSSDSLFLGSRGPIVLAPERLATLTAMEALASLRTSARLDGPLDLYARVLFSSRTELETWSPLARPYTEADPFPPAAWPRRPEQPVDPLQASNDVWAAWSDEVDAWNEREAFDDLPVTMSSVEWPYGHVCAPPSLRCALAGRALTEAETIELSRAMVRHGRFVEATGLLETVAPSPEADRVVQILQIVLGELPPIDPFEVLGRPASGPDELALKDEWRAASASRDTSAWSVVLARLLALDLRASDPVRGTYLETYVQLRVDRPSYGASLLEDLANLPDLPGLEALRAYLHSVDGDDLEAFRAAERATR